MRPVATDGVEWSVCWAVGKTMSRAKKAEPIKVPFEMWTHGGPKDHVLDGILIPAQEGQF